MNFLSRKCDAGIIRWAIIELGPPYEGRDAQSNTDERKPREGETGRVLYYYSRRRNTPLFRKAASEQWGGFPAIHVEMCGKYVYDRRLRRTRLVNVPLQHQSKLLADHPPKNRFGL